MKRRFTPVILSCLLAFGALVGCSGNNEGPAKHIHTMVETPAKAGTCIEAGNIQYWHCDGCSKYFSDEAGTHEISQQEISTGYGPHAYAEVPKKDPTEQEDGWIAHLKCSLCNQLAKGTIENPVPCEQKDIVLPKLVYYTVSYMVEGEKVSSEKVLKGGNPASIPGAQTKAKDAQYTYTWDDWYVGSDKFTAAAVINADTTVEGKFTKTANVYYITFKQDGHEDVKEDFSVEDRTVTEPAIDPEAGYTKVWSSYDLDKYEDQTCTVVKTAKTDTPYKVKHLVQKADFTGYDLRETEDKTGTTGTDTAAAAKSYPGINEAKSFEQAAIAGDGSTVIEIYYDRPDCKPLNKVISFEDGKMPEGLEVAGADTSIDETVATEGTKSLKAELKGTATFKFSFEWMKAMFANVGVDSILFDIKASADIGASNNSNLYAKKGGSWVAIDAGPKNIGGNGPRTLWKTYAFTKTLFEGFVEGDIMLAVHNGSDKTIWIDNLRAGVKEQPATNISFESHSVWQNDNKFKIMNVDNNNSYAPSAYVVSEQQASSGLSVSLSNDYASEGNTSVHITTTTADKVSFYVSEAMYDAADNGILFDMYMPSTGTAFHLHPQYVAGTDQVLSPSEYIGPNQWITFKVRKEQIVNNSFMLFRTCNNATIHDVYVDNIRLDTPNMDFENNVVYENGNIRGASFKYGGKYFVSGDQMAPKNGLDIYTNGLMQVSISGDRATKGMKSLKITSTRANDGLYISKRVYDMLPDAGIKFDMFVTGSQINFNSIASGVSNPIAHAYTADLDQWKEITIPKAAIAAHGQGYIIFCYAQAGATTYIDNVRAA